MRAATIVPTTVSVPHDWESEIPANAQLPAINCKVAEFAEGGHVEFKAVSNIPGQTRFDLSLPFDARPDSCERTSTGRRERKLGSEAVFRITEIAHARRCRVQR